MARRKTTTRRKTATTAPRRKRVTRTKKSSNKLTSFFVPMFFIFCILFCLGLLLLTGYRTATASAFFDVEKIELEGVENIEKEKIKQIVKSHTIQNGVWNSDIEAIKQEVENFKYAKAVSVSRVLPDTVRVIVNERQQIAVIRIDGNDHWADDDGLLLERVSTEDKRPPFIMFGWDESKTDKANENNKKRVELYKQLLLEWQSYELASRVKAVDFADMRDIQAIVEDSGKSVKIRLGNENYGKRLQKGIEVLAATEDCIEYVITSGDKPISGYCK